MAAGCVTVPTYTTNTTRDHAHILGNSGARAVIVSEPEAGEEPDSGGADFERMPPHHRHRGNPRRPGAGLGQRPPLGGADATGEADVAALQGNRSPAVGAPTSPASSTPAAPAARRAGSSCTTARSSTTSRAAPTSSRPISAGTTKCSCRSCRQATPMSIPAGSMFPIALGARDLLRRKPREARRQYRGSAADDHGRRAAAVRDAARADHQVDRERAAASPNICSTARSRSAATNMTGG